MGDQRADSADSRYHAQSPGDGAIPVNAVVGRACVVIWPPSQLQMLPIPGTFKQAALDAANTTTSAAPLAGGFIAAVPALWFLRRGRARPRTRPTTVRAAAPASAPLPPQRLHNLAP